MTPANESRRKKTWLNLLPGCALLAQSWRKMQKLSDFDEIWYTGRYKGPNYEYAIENFFAFTIAKMAAIKIL